MNKCILVVRTSTNSTSAMIELHVVVVVVVDTEKIRRGGSEVCASGQSSKPHERPKPCPECAYIDNSRYLRYAPARILYISPESPECSDIHMRTQEPPMGI